MEPDAGPIFLYDGVCALCNGLVRFLLRCDTSGRVRFASLQSDLARETLVRHGRDPDDLDTAVVIAGAGGPAERLIDRSDALVFVLQQLPGIWRVAGVLLQMIPAPVRNSGYRVVARTRYRVFGKYHVCPLPSPEHRTRFLD